MWDLTVGLKSMKPLVNSVRKMNRKRGAGATGHTRSGKAFRVSNSRAFSRGSVARAYIPGNQLYLLTLSVPMLQLFLGD